MELALTPAQAEEMWTWDDDKILAELGNESWERVKALKAEGTELKDLAESCGMTLEAMREGVKQGSRFPRKPESFDKMCRSLGFPPSEAGRMLGGIYAMKERGDTIGARGAALAKLLRMEDVYRRIKDPTDRAIADTAIDALWRQLNILADRQG